MSKKVLSLPAIHTFPALQKSLTIFGSALYGGATVATCLDYFVEGSVMLLWVWDKVRVKESPQPCWFSWLVLGIWPVCLTLGMQHTCTTQAGQG